MLKLILVNVILLLLTTIDVKATKLYCIRHNAFGLVESLDTCFSSVTDTIAAAVDTLNTASNTTTSSDDTNQLTFDLKCTASNDICAGVEATLSKATDIISSAFQFESALHINASFLSFCQAFNNCYNDDKMVSIGQAYPSISYIMVDNTDNMTRLYPQAMLKQYTNLSVKPNWVQYDIEAQFNNEVNWYFVNDNSSIQSDQTDFLKNCIHEIMHGLGFMVSWGDTYYQSLEPLFNASVLNNFLTPYLLASLETGASLSNYNSSQAFWGFVEFPLDKYIYYTTNESISSAQPLTEITQQLNKFQNSNVVFQSVIDLANAWYSSTEYPIASEVYTKAITGTDVLAMVNNEPILWLETSINPFSAGSSLCHVSQQYTNTTEYLMIYKATQGSSIAQLDQLYPQGPIGPSLLSLMATLGYRINTTLATTGTLKSNIRYWTPSNNLAGSSLNPSPSLVMDTDGPAHVPSSSTISASQKTSDSNKLKISFRFIIITHLFIIIPLLTV